MMNKKFFNRYGDSMPATEASIKQISHNDSLANKYFGTKLPKKGSNLHYLEFMKERIQLMKTWIDTCETAVELYEQLCGYRQTPTESSETEQG